MHRSSQQVVERPLPRHLDATVAEFSLVPLASLGAGVVVHGPDGRVVGCNAGALELLGLTGAELTGRTPRDPRWRLLGADGTSMATEAIPALVTLHTGVALNDVVMGVRRPENRLIWIKVSTRPLHAGRPKDGVVATFVEVTQQRAAEHLLLTARAVDQVLLRSTTEEELLHEMCAVAIRGDSRSLAWVGLANNDEAHSVSILASAGQTGYLFDNIVSWSADDVLGRGPAGVAIREQRTVLIEDLEAEGAFLPWRDRARECGFASVVAVPFKLGDMPAVFLIYDTIAHSLDSGAVQLLTQVGGDLEYGIANLRRVRAVSDSLEATIQALAAIIDVRDPYTAGHQRRVSQLSVAIGRELGLDPGSLEMLRFGALVHDIGKIGVPAEILSKPGRLEPIEYEMVKRHAAVGELTLRRSSLPGPVLEIAGQHHERLDGSGYPRGLKGDEIDFLARVVAVADVVEAMMHHRPYRQSLGQDAALAEVRAGSGRLFDPRVVDACQRVIEGGFEFEDLPLS